MTLALTNGNGAGPGARREPHPRRVAVVGGGLAGITAALDCARAGAQVTLLESRPRLGGAAEATPMTYQIHGKQYVVIAAGGHAQITEEPQSDAIVAFALP